MFENESKLAQCAPDCDVERSIVDRLSARKRNLELQLSETTAALDALQSNPEIALVLTLVSKAIRY